MPESLRSLWVSPFPFPFPPLPLFLGSPWDFPADPSTPAQTGADYPNFPWEQTEISSGNSWGCQTKPNLFLLGLSSFGATFPGFLGSGKTLAQQTPLEFGVVWGQFQRLRSQIPISHEFQRSDPYENHGAKRSRKGEKSKSHKTPRWSESRVSLWSFQEFLINNSREGKSF